MPVRLVAALVVSLAFASPLLAQPTDIVLRASSASIAGSAWSVVSDSTAAGNARAQNTNAGAAKLSAPLANPPSYIELSFQAEAGTPYHLWLRAKSVSNSWANDSVFVQFSASVTASGAQTYRIGTTSGATVNLEDDANVGLSGWGWQDNGYGANALGPHIYFATSGTHTLRIQAREDGLGIDQIVLSPATYLSSPPGALKNDTTILDGENPPPAPNVTLVRGPYLQQVSSSRALIVWATREPVSATVRYRAGTSAETTVSATSTLFPTTRTGMSADYYQHVATLTGLSAGTTYEYDIFAGDIDLTAGSDTVRTAPVRGQGLVRFIAFGDSGVGSASQRQLATVMAADTFDLALHGGDLAYGNTGGTGGATHQTTHDWFFAIYRDWLRDRPMFPALGNHDSRDTNLNGRPYLDMFVLPTNGGSAARPDHAERYYSFDYGPVHFVALDTELAFQDASRRSEQLQWLDADLAATSQPWKVVYFHRSPFSAGGEHGSDLIVRQAFAPIFERRGVQLVISAHEHTYERTLPWNISGTGSKVTYVVSGGGGGPLYAAGSGEWTAFSASVFHYVRATADSCVLALEAVNSSGATFDSARIDRCTTTPPPSAGGDDIVLYASDASVKPGWPLVSDATAAGGARLQNANANAAKLAAPLASPSQYFELTFNAEAGKPYHLWIRGKALSNSWANDSVFVQFSGSVTSTGAATYRIGTTSGTSVNLEDDANAGLSGWGWQDNGYGTNVKGPHIYFAQSGPQTIRIQVREDGLGIDQIVLSPATYLTTSPGALKNDSTIVTR